MSAMTSKILFLALSVTLLFFCLSLKYLENGWTDLRQIHREDVFDSQLGRLWMSRSKVKVTMDKNVLSTPITPATTEWNALATNDVTQRQTVPSRRSRGLFWRPCSNF